MDEIKRLVAESRMTVSKKLVGFKINNEVNEAFKILCKIKNIEYSLEVEKLLREDLESYIDEVDEREDGKL